ncbi:MAG: hypothetical protein IJO38_00470, partial [Akkermansia sp.]|nr:hypothetical protein [Akkermansia sp.]
MKHKYLKAGMLALAAGVVFLSTSCEVYPYGYNSVSVSTDGYSTSVAWTAASYDADGFPIYGYSYGRPVYGYTVSGAPIFSINLLYAGCYVPSWKPAPWCTHHHHYPHGCHHAPKPPKYGHGHRPHERPHMNAPIHKNPSSVMGKPRPGKPSHASSHKPGNHGSHASHKPARPAQVTRPAVRPSTSSPGTSVSRPGSSTRPAARPSENRPGTSVSRPSSSTRPAVRPSTSRPGTSVSRPGSSSTRPAVRPSTSRPGTS